jgi:hypothetical protein
MPTGIQCVQNGAKAAHRPGNASTGTVITNDIRARARIQPPLPQRGRLTPMSADGYCVIQSNASGVESLG